MTPPMTPREKVRQIIDGALNSAIPEPWEIANHATDAILTALASGSGDHAELARLAEAATPGEWLLDGPQCLSAPDGTIVVDYSCCGLGEWEANAAYIRAVQPSRVLALLAENAALRAESENARTVVAWANNSLFGSCGYFHGDPFDGLHLARPIEALKEQATEAERKLAEAVGLLTDAADELASEVEHRYERVKDHPAMTPKYDRDMDTVTRIRTFLSKEAERG